VYVDIYFRGVGNEDFCLVVVLLGFLTKHKPWNEEAGSFFLSLFIPCILRV